MYACLPCSYELMPLSGVEFDVITSLKNLDRLLLERIVLELPQISINWIADGIFSFSSFQLISYEPEPQMCQDLSLT